MAQKRITKRKLKRQKKFLIFIIILLSILDIVLLIKYYNKGNDKVEEQLPPERIQQVEGYKSSEIYYQPITSYSKFKKIFSDNKIAYIAVVNNESPTSQKFVELVQKYTYKENKKIYLLETDKLSKSELKSYNDLDVRFSLIDTNYFILVMNNKVISLTEFNEETINVLIENLGIEE